MNHVRKLRKPSVLNWVLSVIEEKRVGSSKAQSFYNARTLCTPKTPFFYNNRALHTAKASIQKEDAPPNLPVAAKISRTTRRQAQAALLDYLHCTRSLQFTDAEYISKNSPNFIQKLLKNVDNEEEIGRSLARYFRYHPINEFEPFFESLGLKPSEISLFLPRDFMFLSDNVILLENFHVLCNYGIPRSKVGKMYKGATEIFGYDYGVLDSKIRAYEKLGLSKTSVIKLVICSPSVLIDEGDEAFFEVLEEMKGMGIDCNWFAGCLSEKSSYDWGKILGVLHFFYDMAGHHKEELVGFFMKNPGFLLHSSGMEAYSVIGIFLKFGISMKEIESLFLQFPQVQVGGFVANLRQGMTFLFEIEMEDSEIGKILRSHTLILGSCSLKRSVTVRETLNVGKKRLCEIIKDDPSQLKHWVLGRKIVPLPNTGEDEKALMEKTKFLVNLGFVEDSNEMKKALKVFRGKGSELQERFDCLVKAGLSPRDVSKMIKAAPNVLNQSRDLIEKKIDFLVNCLGYPLESLLTFPGYMAYTIDRVKLRFSMYNWLKDEGVASPMLALSTVLAASDKSFFNKFVNHHPRGPEVWERFKKELSTS